MTWLNIDKIPSQQELAIESPATKKWWLCRKHLQLADGVLYYKWEDKKYQDTVLIVPKALQEQVLELCHDNYAAGHLGEEKTLARLKQSFTWYNLAKDVKVYTGTCKICSMNKKATRRPRASLGTYHAGYPMERVHMDLLGPFNESYKGNKYILMIVHQFTKWVDCTYPRPVCRNCCSRVPEWICQELWMPT